MVALGHGLSILKEECLIKCIYSYTGSQASPGSPFDISKFEMFAGNISPVGTPLARTERVLNVYSRHSRDNSQGSGIMQMDGSAVNEQPAEGSSQRAENMEQVLEEGDNQPADVSLHISNTNMGTPAGAVYKLKGDSVTLHSTPKDKGEEGTSVSPRTAAKLKLDELVDEYSQEPPQCEPEVVNKERDREVEFENPMDTEESSEPTNTTSSCSLLDDDEESRSVRAGQL